MGGNQNSDSHETLELAGAIGPLDVLIPEETGFELTNCGCCLSPFCCSLGDDWCGIIEVEELAGVCGTIEVIFCVLESTRIPVI